MSNCYGRISTLIVSMLLMWAYFSGVNISGLLICSLCLIMEILALVLSSFKLMITKDVIFWFPILIIMFLYADNYAPFVLAYNVTNLVLVLLLLVIVPKSDRVSYHIPLAILMILSLVTILFELLEYLFPQQMSNVVKVFLDGEYLANELKALSLKSAYCGLSSSNNVITFSAIIILCYSIYCINKNRIIIRSLLFPLIVFTVLISGERSNIIFIPLALIITYIVQSKKNKLTRYLNILCILGMIIAFVIISEPFLVRYRLFARIFMAVNTYNSGGDITSGRSILYSKAIELWLQKPIFGNGWFYFYSNNVGILKDAKRSHAHNMPLELLCDMGIVGTILVFLPIVRVYIDNLKAIKIEKSYYKQIYKFTLTIQSFFLFDSMLHVTYYSTSIIVIYFVTIFIFLLLKNSKKDVL